MARAFEYLGGGRVKRWGLEGLGSNQELGERLKKQLAGGTKHMPGCPCINTGQGWQLCIRIKVRNCARVMPRMCCPPAVLAVPACLSTHLDGSCQSVQHERGHGPSRESSRSPGMNED